MVFCVTCNSLRESKVCELDNFSEVTMVETCVFVKATVTLLATSEVWLVLLPVAPLAWKISHASVTRHYELLLCYPTWYYLFPIVQSKLCGLLESGDLYFRCHMSGNYCAKNVVKLTNVNCTCEHTRRSCKLQEILHSIKQEYHSKLIRLWKVI